MLSHTHAVMRLSIHDKPQTVRLRNYTSTTAHDRSRHSRTAHSRTKNITKITGDEVNIYTLSVECGYTLCVHMQGVGIGKGPTFECVWFGLTARSPLLQHYMVTHGLMEEQKERVLGPVMGRTQISKLP